MGGSLVRSLLLVTESGINVYEHHAGPSEITSSQLISGMYTAFFAFFEAEMAKGSVHSIELSRTRIIVFTYFDLNCIIEFESYCEEIAITAITDATKVSLQKIITEQRLNPNRYIEAVESSNLSTIFNTEWQFKVLREAEIENLLNDLAIWRKVGDGGYEVHHQPDTVKIHPKQVLSSFGDEETISTVNSSSSPPGSWYHVDLNIGKGLDFLLISHISAKSKILSHIRLITEFLTHIIPEDMQKFSHYLPYYQKQEDGRDFLDFIIIYGWVLPELLETLLIKRKLHLIGTSSSTRFIALALDSLGIQSSFRLSPFYSGNIPDNNMDTYDIICSAGGETAGYPVVNLFENSTKGVVKRSVLRDHIGQDTRPEQMLQRLQEYFLSLEKIHHDLFDILFQNNSEIAAQQIREYRRDIDKFTWLLSLQFFLLKTPFLTNQLVTALQGKNRLSKNDAVSQLSRFSGSDILSSKHSIIEVILKFILVNLLSIVVLAGFIYLIFYFGSF